MGLICIRILCKIISQDGPYFHLYLMQNYFSGWALCGTNSAQATDLEQAMVSFYFGNNVIQTFVFQAQI